MTTRRTPVISVLGTALATVLALVGAGLAAPAQAQAQTIITYTSFGTADWDRDGHQDIVARNDTTGDLWLYPGRSVRGPSGLAPIRIGNGWNDAEPLGIADYDRDGHQDIIERNINTREIWLYPGQSVRGYSQIQPVKLFAYAQASAFTNWRPVGVGDWDNDSYPDLMFFERTPGGPYSGNMIYEIAGNGQRAPQTSYQKFQAGMLGTGFTPYGLTDWDRSGQRDLIFRTSAGDLTLFIGTAQRNYWATGGTTYKIGNGWNGTTYMGATDWDRDGHQDLIYRNDTTRDLWMYPGSSARGYSLYQTLKIGNGW